MDEKKIKVIERSVKRYVGKNKLLAVATLLTVFVLPIIILLVQQKQNLAQHASGSVPPMVLLSRNVPVYASAQTSNNAATKANDNSYDTSWRSGTSSAWIAYDLSAVPAEQKQKVLVAWYNETYGYDQAVSGGQMYGVPKDYTIEVNTADGGGQAPTTGWETVSTITGNVLHSKQAVVMMHGANWIRMNVTNISGTTFHMESELNMDVYDASNGTQDDFIFFGDSITAGAMDHYTSNSIASFGDLIHQAVPNNFPVAENGGIGSLTSASGATYVPQWITSFPGHYVGLSYGTNDANNCSSTTAFYNNYVTMINAVIAAGKVPIIPTLPHSNTTNITQCGPEFNAKIQELYVNFPQVIKGPDLWKFFTDNPSLIPDLHPNSLGYSGMRNLWANTIIQSIYTSSAVVSTTPTVGANTGSITMSPASGNKTVGTAFTVDVTVDGGGQSLNAAQATVTVSPNLSITNIAAPASNACNFTYISGQTPSISNPSFAGAILSSSVNKCTVYTLTLQPNSTGTGTINISQGSIKAYSNNAEIFSTAGNGSYTLAGSTTPTVGATVTPTPTAIPSTANSGLHVSGNSLVNSQGQTIILRGVNRSGTEYTCIQNHGIFEGSNDLASVQAIAAWHTNVVRIPLNEDCWLGINGVNTAYSGANYKQAISNYVNLVNQQGLYAIVDLHWSAPGTQQALNQAAMPDRDHSIDFWTDVATTFKGNNNVLFDLYNEPYPDNNHDTQAGWVCWRDGGTCPGVSFQAAGMQELVNAVRGTGASNVIILGGIQYANALSQWVTYKPTDTMHNIMAAWHIYNFNVCNTTSCFDTKVAPVIAAVPLVAGEVGEDDCQSTFINMVWNWLDQHNAGYTAWVWNTWGSGCGAKSLITDYNGTPSSEYGVAYKTHLAGLSTAPATGVTSIPVPTTAPTLTHVPTNIPTVATITPTTGVTIIPVPTVNNIATDTYQPNLLLSGSKDAGIAAIYINNVSTGITYPSTTTWQKVVSLILGSNTFAVYGKDVTGVQSSIITKIIKLHKLADINGDSVIDLTDISLFGSDWGKTANLGNALSDMNSDAIVNLTDFSILAKQYGQ